MNKSTFKTAAQPIRITIGHETLTADPKLFGTGSVGFFHNGKITLLVDNQPVRFQMSITLTAIGSKDWPE